MCKPIYGPPCRFLYKVAPMSFDCNKQIGVAVDLEIFRYTKETPVIYVMAPIDPRDFVKTRRVTGSFRILEFANDYPFHHPWDQELDSTQGYGSAEWEDYLGGRVLMFDMVLPDGIISGAEIVEVVEGRLCSLDLSFAELQEKTKAGARFDFIARCFTPRGK